MRSPHITTKCSPPLLQLTESSHINKTQHSQKIIQLYIKKSTKKNTWKGKTLWGFVFFSKLSSVSNITSPFSELSFCDIIFYISNQLCVYSTLENATSYSEDDLSPGYKLLSRRCTMHLLPSLLKGVASI